MIRLGYVMVCCTLADLSRLANWKESPAKFSSSVTPLTDEWEELWAESREVPGGVMESGEADRALMEITGAW